jgi:hypothetical protein
MKKAKISLLMVAFCAASVFAQGISVADSAVADTVAANLQWQISDSAAVVPAAKEAPPAPAPAPKVEPAPAPKAEPAPVPVAVPPVVAVHFGVRLGSGISAMRGHIPLHSLVMGPAFSYGAGLTFAVEFNSLFTLAPELQYTLYRTNREVKIDNGGKFRELNEVGANLHSFELPILARFSFASIYAETGPQVGYNYYAKIYRNSENEAPKINVFAFGPSAGFGVNVSETLIGIRGHFGLMEYAKKTKGYPWAAQISLTKFFF